MLKWAGEAITPRAAIYGGRVECFAPYMRLSAGQIRRGYRGVDWDFVSMYPAVQKCAAFPTRPHPTIHQYFEMESWGYNWVYRTYTSSLASTLSSSPYLPTSMSHLFLSDAPAEKLSTASAKQFSYLSTNYGYYSAWLFSVHADRKQQPLQSHSSPGTRLPRHPKLWSEYDQKRE